MSIKRAPVQGGDIDALRARLRHLGYAQAEGFTWTAAAAGALRAIEAAGGIGE